MNVPQARQRQGEPSSHVGDGGEDPGKGVILVSAGQRRKETVSTVRERENGAEAGDCKSQIEGKQARKQKGSAQRGGPAAAAQKAFCYWP